MGENKEKKRMNRRPTEKCALFFSYGPPHEPGRALAYAWTLAGDTQSARCTSNNNWPASVGLFSKKEKKRQRTQRRPGAALWHVPVENLLGGGRGSKRTHGMKKRAIHGRTREVGFARVAARRRESGPGPGKVAPVVALDEPRCPHKPIAPDRVSRSISFSRKKGKRKNNAQ